MNPAELCVFLTLLAAYTIGEFALVTPRYRTGRGALWALLLHPVLALLAAGAPATWLTVSAVGITHAALGLAFDLVPSRWLDGSDELDRRNRRLALFLIRHAAHTAVVLVFATVVIPFARSEDTYRVDILGPHSATALIWLAGLVLAVCAGARVIEILVDPIVIAMRRASGNPDTEIRPRGFPDISRTIGHWERAIIYLLVVTGNLAGVAFLAAAKSIFRVGDLQDTEHRRQAEFILVGTLMSFSWALFVAAGVRALIGAAFSL